MGYQTDLLDVLRKHGCRVVTVKGWRTRGSSYFNPKGSVVHHTAGPSSGNAPSLNICIHGRSDLPGPLCNTFTARDGTVFLVAAGEANHAGEGSWRGLSGNHTVFGSENENTGLGQPWPAAQLDAMYRTHAAFSELAGDMNASECCGHKEWTSRKIDPTGIDMGQFRARVRDVLSGQVDNRTDVEKLIDSMDKQELANLVENAARRGVLHDRSRPYGNDKGGKDGKRNVLHYIRRADERSRAAAADAQKAREEATEDRATYDVPHHKEVMGKLGEVLSKMERVLAEAKEDQVLANAEQRQEVRDLTARVEELKELLQGKAPGS